MNTASHLLTDVDPSQDAAEADLAAVAYRCLSAALDHSNAPRIALVGDDGIRQDMPVLALPPRALRFLAEVLKEMALQRPVVVMPQKHELSTQEAAAFLNVSRPFVIKEIEAGRLKCRKVNRHRRIEFAELQRYQQAQQATSEQALQRLNTLSEDLGLEF